MSVRDFERLSREADAVGLRLEMVRGIVTEVLSRDYGAKDLVIGVPFY